MWDAKYIMLIADKYDSLPANKYVNLEIVIPHRFCYDTKIIVEFIRYIRDSISSNDYTITNMFKVGKDDRLLTFDFVIKDNKLRIYITIAKKQYTQLIGGIIRFFPGLIVKEVQNPFGNWPKDWKEEAEVEGNTEFASYAFGFREESFHPFFAFGNLPKSAETSSLDNFLRHSKNLVYQNEILILQYVFVSNTSYSPSQKYKNEYMMSGVKTCMVNILQHGWVLKKAK